jgi:hypothetical protein
MSRARGRDLAGGGIEHQLARQDADAVDALLAVADPLDGHGLMDAGVVDDLFPAEHAE